MKLNQKHIKNRPIKFNALSQRLFLAGLFSLTPLLNVQAQTANVTENNSTIQPETPSASKETVTQKDEANWAIYGQLTNITMRHNAFHAPYSGTNSLTNASDTQETTDATLFIGKRLWQGAEVWINPEIDQGFGFNNTLGVAGYPSGGAYKIGANLPYFRVPKLFVRQAFNLSGEAQTSEASANQFANNLTANNVVITAGKFSVVDIFDTNAYAHDARADFLNWSLIDAGAYDYAADSWGYTYGVAVEWTQNWWTARAGFFQLSPVPNAKITRVNFGSNSTNAEFEARQNWFGQSGKIKLLAWVNQGKMGSYSDATARGIVTNSIPDAALVRKQSSKSGVVLNIEQPIRDDAGIFIKASKSQGNKEAYEFTDINQSIAIGASAHGNTWGRANDVVGLAIVQNSLSNQAQNYFKAGGLGILIGDGKLNYAPEKVIEGFYAMQLNTYATLSLDVQRVTNPAYNQDRGPVNIIGSRLHVSF